MSIQIISIKEISSGSLEETGKVRRCKYNIAVLFDHLGMASDDGGPVSKMLDETKRIDHVIFFGREVLQKILTSKISSFVTLALKPKFHRCIDTRGKIQPVENKTLLTKNGKITTRLAAYFHAVSHWKIADF